MSQTTSRGMFSAKHWSAVAVAVEAGLHTRYGEPWDVKRYSAGSLQSLGRFFYWALDGAAQDERKTTDPKVPTMAGMSCLSIVMQVLERMGRKPTVALAKKHALNHHDLIRRIQLHHRITGSDMERRELRQFLQKLIELGEH